MKTKKELYTLKELEPILGVKQRTLYNYITKGQLEAIKPAGQWRVTAEALNKFLKGSGK